MIVLNPYSYCHCICYFIKKIKIKKRLRIGSWNFKIVRIQYVRKVCTITWKERYVTSCICFLMEHIYLNYIQNWTACSVSLCMHTNSYHICIKKNLKTALFKSDLWESFVCLLKKKCINFKNKIKPLDRADSAQSCLYWPGISDEIDLTSKEIWINTDGAMVRSYQSPVLN